jgi:integrase
MLAQWVSKVLVPSAWSAKTKGNRVGDVAAFGGWCVEAGIWTENHAGALRGLLRGSTRGREQQATVRPWTVAEVQRLLERMDAELPADDPLHAMVRIALYTGMRREEIAGLRGADVDVVDDVRVLRVREGKSRAAIRDVPVHSEIVDLVSGVAAGDFIVSGLGGKGGQDGRRAHSAGVRFSKLKAEWGFDATLNFHGLRRTFAKRLESAGVPQNVAESLLGHARRSLSYGRYSDGADTRVLAEAVEAVSYSEVAA